MSYTQPYVEMKDANNDVVKMPVLSDGTLDLPMHSPAGGFPTYRATSVLSNSVPNSSVDWLQIQGSSSKTVFVTRIALEAVPGATTPQSQTIGLARRTATYTAGGGGTLDSILGAGTPPNGASPAYATGNTPTAAITVAQTTAATSSSTGGFIDAKQLYFGGSGSAPTSIEWRFGDIGQQPLILSGDSDFVVLTFGGAVTPAAQINVTIEWFEA